MRKRHQVILTVIYFSAPRWYHIAISLTRWGRVIHIYVGNLTINGSDNGLSPGRSQTIIWINAGIFSESFIESHTFSYKKMHFKISSVKRWPLCLGLNVLMTIWCYDAGLLTCWTASVIMVVSRCRGATSAPGHHQHTYWLDCGHNQ